MATASVSVSIPTEASHRTPSGQPVHPTPPPTMSTQQQQSQPNTKSLSPAYIETHAILTRLLTTLQSPASPYHTTYSPWITHYGIAPLTTSLLSCIRPTVWTFLSTPRWSLDALKQISSHPGDLRYEGRAIYLNGILGLDKRLRGYVGQTTCLRQRVAQHLNFRYRRDHPSLHYWALQRSVFNVFAVLAVLPPTAQPSGPGLGMEEVPLVLNVLEMLMCLVFRSLPVESLREWLPIDGHGHEHGESGTGIASSNWRRVSREGVMGGLNIACPLDQGVTQLKERPFVDLRDDEDELVKEWLREMDRER